MSKKKIKPVQTHVLIDNNILVRVVSQSSSGNEFSLWEKLTELVKTGKVHLILPEVIQLEFETFARTAKRSFDSAIETFSKFDFRDKPWNETDQLKEHLKAPITAWQEKTWKEWEDRIHNVESCLKHKNNSTFVGLLDAMVALKKRRITKRMPPKPPPPNPPKKEERDDDKDSDLLILESAVLSFGGEINQKQLLICTENLKDFRATDTSDVVHLPFGEDLPPNRLFKDLKTLIEFIDEGKQVDPLTEDEIEEIEEAVGEEVSNLEFSNFLSRGVGNTDFWGWEKGYVRNDVHITPHQALLFIPILNGQKVETPANQITTNTIVYDLMIKGLIKGKFEGENVVLLPTKKGLELADKVLRKHFFNGEVKYISLK